MMGLNFFIETTVAPNGFFSYLKVQGLTEDVWKTWMCADGSKTVECGKWGSTQEDSIRLLKGVIEKDIKKWSNHRDPRPSQVRRIDLLKMGLASI